MRKKIFWMLSFCFIISTSNVLAKPVDENFNDDNFYACVIDNYNAENGNTKNVTDILTNSEFETIEHLNCSNENIEDITGIVKLSSLQSINLSNNNITSLEPLLQNDSNVLEELNVSNNNIRGLYLSKFPNLSNLDLSNNNMKSLVIDNYITIINISGNSFLKNLNLTVLEDENIYNHIYFGNMNYTDDKFTISYIIDDENVAIYDESSAKIIAKSVGTTSAKLIIKNGENIIYGSSEESNSTIIVNSDCEESISGAQKIEIYFDSNGGNEIDAIIKTVVLGAEDEKVELPTPEKDGAKFLGWYSDSKLTNKVNINYYNDIFKLDSINTEECNDKYTIKLFAKWEKIEKNNPSTGVYTDVTICLTMIVIASIIYITLKNKYKKV